MYAGACEEVAGSPQHSRVLTLLIERMDGSHDAGAPQALPLPEPATEAEAEAMIDGLAGSGPQRLDVSEEIGHVRLLNRFAVVAGHDVRFGRMPHGAVAGGLYVEAVLEDQ